MAAEPVNVYTDEKAKRLMRTFGASMAFSFLIVWFEMMILRPAADYDEEMVGGGAVDVCFKRIFDRIRSVCKGNPLLPKMVLFCGWWPSSSHLVFPALLVRIMVFRCIPAETHGSLGNHRPPVSSQKGHDFLHGTGAGLAILLDGGG